MKWDVSPPQDVVDTPAFRLCLSFCRSSAHSSFGGGGGGGGASAGSRGGSSGFGKSTSSSSSSSRGGGGGSSSYAAAESSDAREKFGNAKAISSDMYFNQETDEERSEHMSRFQGSSSISSDAYFGRESSGSAGSVGVVLGRGLPSTQQAKSPSIPTVPRRPGCPPQRRASREGEGY